MAHGVQAHWHVPESIHEIDSSIARYQQGLSQAMLSRSDPRRPTFLFGIAQKQYDRYKLSNQREDLDNSITTSANSRESRNRM